MLVLRLKKHNASMGYKPDWKWKIQYRRTGRGGVWKDYIAHGRMVLFDYGPNGRDAAVNYMAKIRFPGVMKFNEERRLQEV